MTLGDLLTLLRESILNDRTDRVAGSSDYLWTDHTLVTFINEAHRRFARRSLILRDGTTDEATLVTLKAGQSTYPLHPSVIAVVSGKNAAQESDLTRVGHSILSAFSPLTERWQDPAAWSGYQPGPTLAFTTDEALNDIDGDTFEQITLRVFPTPTAAQDGQTLRLRVIREPLEDFAVNAKSAVPEVPRAHHLEMLDWAAYLALRIVDDDAGAPKRAQEFAASFEGHVQEARKLVMRKLFAPTGWGFGRGGFSWGGN